MPSPIPRRWLPVVLLGGLLAIPIGACSDGGPNNPPAEDVDAYVTELPPWEEFSPAAVDSEEATAPSKFYRALAEGVEYACVETPYDLTRTPDRVVTLDPDANILWVGALLEGKGYKQGIGSLRELAIRERSPVTISIDLLANQNSRAIRNPTLATVNQAVGELIQAATDEGNKAGSSISFSQENTYGVSQAALKMGLSARFFSFSARAMLDASRGTNERTVTAHFVQRMFTVSMVLPGGPAEVFNSDFTLDRLNEMIDRGAIGPDNIPVYVANVVYGRILDFTVTSSESYDRIRAALSASYGSIASGSVDVELLQVLQRSSIHVVTVGGEGKNAIALIQSGNLRDYFSEDAALTSARPISYTVRNLGDNSLAKVSETTSYNVKECTALPMTGAIDVNMSPNDALVTLKGAAGTNEGPDLGDQLYKDLPKGGYTVTVFRDAGDGTPDSTWTVETREVTVSSGDTAHIAITTRPLSQVGEVYSVAVTAVDLNNMNCASGLGEGAIDVYYWFRLTLEDDTEALEELPASSYIGVGNGYTRPLNLTGQRSASVTRSPGIRIRGEVWDYDPVGSDDLIASFDRKEDFPNIATGDRTLAIGVNGCVATLHYTVTSLGPISP